MIILQLSFHLRVIIIIIMVTASAIVSYYISEYEIVGLLLLESLVRGEETKEEFGVVRVQFWSVSEQFLGFSGAVRAAPKKTCCHLTMLSLSLLLICCCFVFVIQTVCWKTWVVSTFFPRICHPFFVNPCHGYRVLSLVAVLSIVAGGVVNLAITLWTSNNGVIGLNSASRLLILYYW